MSDIWENVLLALLTLLPIAAFWWSKKRVEPKANETLEQRREEYGEAMVARYGEPQQMLWTRDMPLLFYEDFMVLAGIQVPYGCIANVTCNNSNDFGPGECYQVIVRTTLPGHEFLHVLMDTDMEEAIGMVEYIRNHADKERLP